MNKKLLSLTLLIYILVVCCSKPNTKIEKVDSLKEAYFNITYKLEIMKKLKPVMWKKLSDHHNYEKWDFIEAEFSDDTSQIYTFTNNN